MAAISDLSLGNKTAMGEAFKDIFDIADSQILKTRGIAPVCFSEVDSTNSAARRYAAEGGAAPALFVADTQSAGRGRMGRTFFSPAETGIYMTLLFDVTDDAPTSAVAMTSAAAVAVACAAERLTGAECAIKWVNDVYVSGRKACGILAEAFAFGDRRYACVGVGINLATADFPEELRGIAGSLCKEPSQRQRYELTVAVAAELFDIYGRVRKGDRSYMAEYRRRSMVLGKMVTFTRNGISDGGLAVSINDDGGLVVEKDDGTSTVLSSGEITLRVNK